MAKKDPLIPPDAKRCQFEHRPGSFMTLGPRSWVRCEAKPDFVAAEIKNGKDGRKGSMSLCSKHAKLMLEQEEFRGRVRLTPI